MLCMSNKNKDNNNFFAIHHVMYDSIQLVSVSKAVPASIVVIHDNVAIAGYCQRDFIMIIGRSNWRHLFLPKITFTLIRSQYELFKTPRLCVTVI